MIEISKDGHGFTSDKLGTQCMNFSVFNIISDFLKEKGGSAPKGVGRGKNNKVGFADCTSDTVIWAVATKYYGKVYGDSTFDSVFLYWRLLWKGQVLRLTAEVLSD